MKKNYPIKAFLLLIGITLCCINAVKAQVRIAKLDPATNTVTLKNFGNTTVPISGYWFCNFPSYAQVSNMTSTASLAAGEEVVITSSINFNVADGEFGLYNTNSFGSSSAMEDYMQWGSAGHQREGVAVNKGIWTANTFIDLEAPFAYSGDGSQNGADNWITFRNIRIVQLDPSTNTVTLRNFSNTTQPISNLWFCNFPSYAQVNSMTTQTTLAAGAEIVINSAINFNVGDGEFGLYNTNSFGSASAMEDYIQWGSANHQRESVAVSKGIWGDDTFINSAPPFQYTGNGSQDGVVFWSTLSVNDFDNSIRVSLFPNPAHDTLNIQLNNLITDGTIQIFDVLGKQVFSQFIVANQPSEIDVAQWNNGIYLIKISSENTNEVKRFVKN